LDPGLRRVGEGRSAVSIPRSGFCWFGPDSLVRVTDHRPVSIPRSGFCWFGPAPLSNVKTLLPGFNPSVGILLVWTSRTRAGQSDRTAGFNPSVGILLVWTRFQTRNVRGVASVSIPRSGFCWFGLPSPLVEAKYGDSFNPSVGILLVWTRSRSSSVTGNGKFQSLGRDSVGLDIVYPLLALFSILFQSLGRDSVGLDWERNTHLPPPPASFNPSVGILLVWTICSLGNTRVSGLFQSLGRDSVGLDALWTLIPSSPIQSFNPSVGILLVWTSRNECSSEVHKDVSIPRSGFCWFGPIHRTHKS